MTTRLNRHRERRRTDVRNLLRRLNEGQCTCMRVLDKRSFTINFISRDNTRKFNLQKLRKLLILILIKEILAIREAIKIANLSRNLKITLKSDSKLAI